MTRVAVVCGRRVSWLPLSVSGPVRAPQMTTSVGVLFLVFTLVPVCAAAVGQASAFPGRYSQFYAIDKSLCRRLDWANALEN